MSEFDYSQPHKMVTDCSDPTAKGRAVAKPVALTPEEIAEHKAKEVSWIAAEPQRVKDEAQRKINALEAAHALPRALRESLLKAEGTHPVARAKVNAVDTEINQIAVAAGLRKPAA